MKITLQLRDGPKDEFLLQFRRVIFTHLTDHSLDVSTICQQLSLARSTIHTRVKQQTGMSTTQYIRYIRMEVACALLTQTSLQISEVAYRTGFQSHTYFSRCFRAVYGMSPKDWRDLQGS